jgi:amino acid adenylation domain-containing protein
MAHEHASLALAQRCSQAPSSAPLFSSLLNYRHSTRQKDSGNEEARAWSGIRMLEEQERTNYPLTLSVDDYGDVFGLTAQTAAGIDASWICQYMQRALEKLVEALELEPNRQVRSLDVLPENERRQLLEEWNDTKTEYAKDTCIQQLFEAQVDRTPDATAVIFGHEELTYRELNNRANQLGHYLQRLGVGPESLIAVCVERSVEMIIGILGILKAGGSYVPLDPNYPEQRLAYITEDAQVAMIVSSERLLNRLQGLAGRIVCIDRDWEEISRHDEQNVGSRVVADDLAYLIYTSGSTGRPKGVVIEHRNTVALIHWARAVFSQEELAGVLATTSICFDLSVFELFVPLCWGGKVILVENALQLPGLPLADGVTLVNTVPSVMTELMRMGGIPASVCTVNLAGEPLKTRLVREIYEQETIRRVYDLYGPSEGATYNTIALRSALGPATIGRPIANTRIYILDVHGQPAPTGVAGELYLGGVQVGRGYLNRHELTAERFLPDPFGREPGARVYRTGDLSRWLPDGQIEFLGRNDFQVKIRGFRIELGEIESILEQHPAVKESIALVREEAPGDRRLVAYVVPDSQYLSDTQSHDQHLSQWQSVWSGIQTESSSPQDPLLNLVGWNSSYTGEPIPQAEMREWVESTVERILSLRPKRALEIGCGTGLLLLRIAPHCEEFCGTDFVEETLDYTRRQINSRGLDHVSLLHRAADNFEGFSANAFDAIILNSVIQYFPSADYLLQVLERAIDIVEPGGFIFIGDVRNYALLEAFHASVQVHQAPSSLPKAELRRGVQKRVEDEEELVIDPAFFTRLKRQMPGISHIEISLKRGRHHNELTRFRYDVAIHLGGKDPGPAKIPCLEWEERKLGPQAIRGILENTKPELLGVRRVPNARLLKEVKSVEMLAEDDGPETVGELQKALLQMDWEAIDPEELWALGEQIPYQVNISWSGSGGDGCFDVVFAHRPAGGRKPMRIPMPLLGGEEANPGPLDRCANNPVQALLAPRLGPILRSFLQAELPDYMLPSAWVVMRRFPLTSNGKVDRKALPSADQARKRFEGGFIAARTPLEEALAGIWSQVLGVDRIGVCDNFFELGGHSLLATQLISRMRKAFQVELSVRHLFETPTIAGLAECIKNLVDLVDQASPHSMTKGLLLERASLKKFADRNQTETIRRRSEKDPAPLSFAQERLWFLDQLERGSTAYNIPAAVRLIGPLNVVALEMALGEITHRHEVLRTTFQAIDGNPQQIIHPFVELRLPIVDISEMAEEARAEGTRMLAAEQARGSFDLARGPLLKLALVRVGQEDHVILLTIHHTICDGWSIGLLVKEVGALYDAFSTGKVSPLVELPIQYADYAHWQRQQLRGEVLQSQLSYWREHLSGAPPTVNLLSEQRQPGVYTKRCGEEYINICGSLTEAVKALSIQEGVTLYMTLLAAFKALLHRYTGQNDLVVGSPVANRNDPDVENVIGFFVNTLVLRTDLSDNPTFRQLLAGVRKTTLNAYTYQDLPFGKLVEELKPERDLNRTPLFNIMFNLHNYPAEKFVLRSLTMSMLQVSNGSAQFDLSVDFAEHPEGLNGSFEYRADLFSAAMIKRMAAHFQVLLTSIVSDPNRQISYLPSLTDEERNQLLVEWNDTSVDYPIEIPLHKLFEAQVDHCPDAIAVVFDDEQLTYRELNRRTNLLAHYLQATGVGPEARVGVCMERSIEMAVGLLAVLKAGGAYMPLEPDHPKERLGGMIESSGAQFLLTQEKLLTKLPRGEGRRLCLDTEWELVARESQEEIIDDVGAENLAYVIYTSGSTGAPKGAMNTHRGICNRLLWMQDVYQLGPADRVLHKTPFGFDVSVWEIFWPLITGACIVIARPGGHQECDYLVELIVDHRISVLHFVPTMLGVFLKEPGLERCGHLKQVFCSGEAMSTGLQERFFARLNAKLHNLYGPTEAAIDVTFWACQDSIHHQVVPIGRPIANTQIYILDQHLQAISADVPGELYIGGDGLARGYFRSPEQTAERFIPNPFGEELSSRLYKTGDVCRYLTDGNIEFLGRVDHQVKIRGLRIELGEIEAALSRHAVVRESIVVVREDDRERLAAYVVPNPGFTVTSGALQAHLEDKLPRYMIPSAFVALEALPVTSNGKVDRKRLPSLSTQRPELDQPFIAARTREERMLAEIWSSVLGVEEVGIHDNFFELGGDSMRSIQVLGRAKESGINFSLQQLFQYQTIHGLTSEFSVSEDNAINTKVVQPYSLISEDDRRQMPGKVEDAYPLTMLQAGMMFHSEYNPDTSIYHDIFGYHLQLRFDFKSISEALRRLAIRHEVLRTAFDLTSFSRPLQLVYNEVQVPLEITDIRHLSADLQEESLAAWVEEERGRMFEWSSAPLLRFHIHLRTEETFQFTVSFHHAMLDGWSVASMLTELFRDYLSLLSGSSVPIEKPKIAFRDYVALETEALESEECRHYWIEKLGDRTATILPRRPASLPKRARRVYTQEIPLTVEVYEKLTRVSNSTSLPIKSLLLASHIKVLSLLSGQSDILTGLSSNGRPEDIDGDRVLGLFLNTLPFRMKLPADSWIGLAKEVFQVERELLPYRRFPLPEIQRLLGGQPMFEATFNFVHFHVYQGVAGVDGVQLLGDQVVEETNYTLVVAFSLTLSSRLYLNLRYDGNELCQQQIAAIGGYFERTLLAIANDPFARHDFFSALSLHEQHQLLVEWNEPGAKYDESLWIHELFEAQAVKTPDALAVVFDNQQLTYLELSRRTNQLAHHLQSLGVGPDALVGICMERSVEMVIGILSILKAGGAYLPLDPESPLERLEYMLKDTGVGVVLTQEKFEERLLAYEGKIVYLDVEWERISEESASQTESGVVAGNMAYVIYTSGSTGRPKGVMVRHRNLVNYTQDICRRLELAEGGLRFATVSTITADLGNTCIYPSLVSGGCLHILSYEAATDGKRFGEYLQRNPIDVLKIVPSHLSALLGTQPKRERMLPRKYLILGGEALSYELVERIRERSEGCEVINHYGPTETTIGSLTARVKEEEEKGRRSATVPIGRPIANTTIYVLDRGLTPTPVGARGELYIAGEGVARGYWKRPELTAERFIPNLFSANGGETLYRTGDVVRYLSDGSVEYLGRKDHQVKIRGHRIELGEIEAALSRHAGVRESIVVVREDDREQLTAYVIPNPGFTVTSGALQAHLEDKLPRYMIPSAFVALEALPVTSNGKVDRKRLPHLSSQPPNLGKEFVAPRNSTESTIAEICSQILKVDRVGAFDSFFELGGHSLLAIHLISQLRSTFQIHIPLATLYKSPTVAEMAVAIAQITASQADPDALAEIIVQVEKHVDEEAQEIIIRKND